MTSRSGIKSFFTHWLEADQFYRLLRTLQEPSELGARFEWRHDLTHEELEWYKSHGYSPGRDLWVQWADEPIRAFDHSDLDRIVDRLHDLGFEMVTTAWLWDILWITLPHDGHGRGEART